MTARVTSSASLSLGVMPTGGRGGASCGDACSSSSIFTYSAVARVSRSASTRPPTRSTLGSNADHGHPRPHAGPLGINRLVMVALECQAVGMRTYGQYCPIARASELLAERWSLIILRNIVLVGCRTFNEIADGAPGLSRGLLSKRLRDLERAGVVEIRPKADGPGST